MFGIGKRNLDQAVEFACKVIHASGCDRQEYGVLLEAAKLDPYIAGYLSFLIEAESMLSASERGLPKDEIKLVMTGVMLDLYKADGKAVIDFSKHMTAERNEEFASGVQYATRYMRIKLGHTPVSADPDYEKARERGRALVPGIDEDVAAIFGYQFLWFDCPMAEFRTGQTRQI